MDVSIINKKIEEKATLEKSFLKTANMMFGKEWNELTKEELYQTLASTIRQYISENWIITNKYYADNNCKEIYYFSIEFLLGRLLNTNLINLDMKDICTEALEDLDLDITELFKQEPDAGLGNGGLGRLAACFIDSMASLALPGHGCTIRYQYGLFEQKIIDDNQVEIPDNWLKNGFAWEYRKADKEVDVKFGGDAYLEEQDDGSFKLVYKDYSVVAAVPYDVPIVGYHNKVVNTLRLWSAEVPQDFASLSGTREQLQERLRQSYQVQAITSCLYPEDSSYEGKMLRLTQEYFLVSAGVQSIVRHYKRRKGPLADFAKKIAIHINDTHPAMAIPELMRILVDEEDMDWTKAWEITTNTVAYTNHTIMPEALETWPIDMFKKLLPRIYMIIDEINKRFLDTVRKLYPGDEDLVRRVSIIQDGVIHMARLSVVGSHSVNGVAKIHSNILKNYTMKDFDMLYPKKFNNKTNGITHRRWLIAANPELSNLLDEAISDKWRKDPSRLTDLLDYQDDKSFLDKLDEIKKNHKIYLAGHIKRRNGIIINPDSIYDIQVKRIHSYKRQIMNILHVMYVYNQLKQNPDFRKNMTPRTFMFAGKAAPGYHIAKETIRLINSVADVINADSDVNKYIQVVFLANYSVTLAEKLFPAADVSEQISLAGKEASGTSNMKFMMNGAITLGTLDGANVEIRDAVGDDNCVIFGLKEEEVAEYYRNGLYSAWTEYNVNPKIHDEVDQLLTGPFVKNGDFHDLHNYLFNSNDEYFVFKDFMSYCEAHAKIKAKYLDKYGWLKSSLINIAHSGIFSSDRTIAEYAKDIWDVHPIDLSK